jgi:cytochrome b subunit of formate dehydrogenase
MKWNLGTKSTVFVVTVVALGGIFLGFAQEPSKEKPASAKPIGSDEPGFCLSCHGGEGFVIATPDGGTKSLFVDGRKYANSVHRELGCIDCHAGAEKVPHVRSEITPASCADCHSDEKEQFDQSIHAPKDGESPALTALRPTCISCHEGNPHAVVRAANKSRDVKLNACYACHSDGKRMKPFGVTTVAAYSYKRSFHGKAHFYGSNATAVCNDCHGNHAVLAAKDPRSKVSPANAAKTCGKCHAGAAPAFAMSGVSHLDLKIQESPMLQVELGFFRILLWSVLAILFLSVLLDVRVGFRLTYKRWRKSLVEFEPKPEEATYRWYTPWQQIQHWIFAAAFILLVATGLPLRFPEIGWLNRLMELFGGLNTSRLIHRISAVVLSAMFLSHFIWLLWAWRKINYSVKRIPMMPTKRDWQDFKEMMGFYFGKRNSPPTFGRFSFRAKFGYLVEYWGVPVMLLSGLVLAFPVQIGNHLGDLGVSFAYIAHGYEATLAAGSILVWHIYTTMFSPVYAPMAGKMIRGRITEEELRREHGDLQV